MKEAIIENESFQKKLRVVMFVCYIATFVTYILIILFESSTNHRYFGLVNVSLVLTSDLM